MAVSESIERALSDLEEARLLLSSVVDACDACIGTEAHLRDPSNPHTSLVYAVQRLVAGVDEKADALEALLVRQVLPRLRDIDTAAARLRVAP